MASTVDLSGMNWRGINPIPGECGPEKIAIHVLADDVWKQVNPLANGWVTTWKKDWVRYELHHKITLDHPALPLILWAAGHEHEIYADIIGRFLGKRIWPMNDKKVYLLKKAIGNSGTAGAQILDSCVAMRKQYKRQWVTKDRMRPFPTRIYHLEPERMPYNGDTCPRLNSNAPTWFEHYMYGEIRSFDFNLDRIVWNVWAVADIKELKDWRMLRDQYRKSKGLPPAVDALTVEQEIELRHKRAQSGEPYAYPYPWDAKPAARAQYEFFNPWKQVATFELTSGAVLDYTFHTGTAYAAANPARPGAFAAL